MDEIVKMNERITQRTKLQFSPKTFTPLICPFCVQMPENGIIYVKKFISGDELVYCEKCDNICLEYINSFGNIYPVNDTYIIKRNNKDYNCTPICVRVSEDNSMLVKVSFMDDRNYKVKMVTLNDICEWNKLSKSDIIKNLFIIE